MGGSLKIPRLQQAVSGALPDAEVVGAGPALSSDEAIALGAALQAGCLPADWDGDVADLSADVQALAKALFYMVSKLCLFSEGFLCHFMLPCLQGEYHHCPPQIFLKFSRQQDSGMKDTQALNLLPKVILLP